MSESPSPFLLNTIKLIDPKTTHLLSERTTIDCPCCGASHQLYVRPINHPTYFLCMYCQRAYDSVLLHHTVTASESLKDSLDVILQNDGYIGKVKKADYNNILKRAEALEKYNMIRDYTYSCLSKNRWLTRFLKTLQIHGLYHGAKDSDKHVLAQTVSLVSSTDLGKKQLLGINVKDPLYSRKKEWSVSAETVMVPTWSPDGLADYWFLGEESESDITCYTTARAVSRGGLSFVNETTHYKTLLATENPRAAIQTHLRHRRMFGTPAPIVLFSKRTSRNDFKPLLGKKIIFLDASGVYSMKHHDEDGLRVLQYALDLDGSAFSTISSTDLGEEASFDLMNEAIENSYSTYNMMDMVVRSDTYDFEPYRTLDLNRFFAYLIRKRKNYGLFRKLGKIKTYPSAVIGGRAIEETPDGYRDFITGELYSNFIIEIREVMINVDRSETEYRLVFKRNCKVFHEVTKMSYAMSEIIGPIVKSINNDSLKEGNSTISFIKSPLSTLPIEDLVYEFNQDRISRCNTLPKTDYSLMYNKEHDAFMLPTCIIRGDGVIHHYSTSMTKEERDSRAFCLEYSSLDGTITKNAKKTTDPLIFDIVAYLALSAASVRNKDVKIKPLIIFGRDSEIDEIQRAVPMWPTRIVGRLFYNKNLSKKKIESIKKHPFVVEVPMECALKIGAGGDGYVLGKEFPVIYTNRKRNRSLEKVVTYCFAHCLSGILKNGFTTLDEVRQFQYEKLSGLVPFVSSKFLPYKKSPILTQEECIKLTSKENYE